MNAHGGDRGMTSLLSGERVPKTHPRIEACGDVDELASVLGVVAAALSTDQPGLVEEIRAVQADLLGIGALLSAAPGSPALASLRPPAEGRIRALEDSARRMETELPRLQNFIIPGGTPTAAWAHVARAVCRRAERRVAALSAERAPGLEGGPDPALAYLNRLSSWLFELARWCNKLKGVSETPWKG